MTMFACPTTLFARPSHPVCSCICIQLQGSRCSPHRCVRAAIQPGSWAVAVADARQAEPCVAMLLCCSVALSLCCSVALSLCCSVACLSLVPARECARPKCIGSNRQGGRAS